MNKGIQAVASAVNSFHEQCPDTKLVLVGYSQGGQIMDNAFCGGPDESMSFSDASPQIDSSALSAVAAVIEMGSPRFVSGLDYGVGTCSAGGFSARPSGYTCSVRASGYTMSTSKTHTNFHVFQSSAKMQSYCDAADPYCCDGSDEATHQGYGDVYGQDALTFIQGQLDGAGSSSSADSTQSEGAANGTSASTEDSSSADNTASVPIAGDGQSSGSEASGSQDSGAQSTGTQDAGAQGANQWNQDTGAQGGNQWDQNNGGQGQWGGWGKKN